MSAWRCSWPGSTARSPSVFWRACVRGWRSPACPRATSTRCGCPARTSCRWPRRRWRGPAATRRSSSVGAVIRGETPHFDYVCDAAASGLLRVSLDTGVPCTFGVLTCDTFAQAEARAGGAVGNKGEEAADAAVAMANLIAARSTEARPLPGTPTTCIRRGRGVSFAGTRSPNRTDGPSSRPTSPPLTPCACRVHAARASSPSPLSVLRVPAVAVAAPSPGPPGPPPGNGGDLPVSPGTQPVFVPPGAATAISGALRSRAAQRPGASFSRASRTFTLTFACQADGSVAVTARKVSSRDRLVDLPLRRRAGAPRFRVSPKIAAPLTAISVVAATATVRQGGRRVKLVLPASYPWRVLPLRGFWTDGHLACTPEGRPSRWRISRSPTSRRRRRRPSPRADGWRGTRPPAVGTGSARTARRRLLADVDGDPGGRAAVPSRRHDQHGAVDLRTHRVPGGQEIVCRRPLRDRLLGRRHPAVPLAVRQRR